MYSWTGEKSAVTWSPKIFNNFWEKMLFSAKYEFMNRMRFFRERYPRNKELAIKNDQIFIENSKFTNTQMTSLNLISFILHCTVGLYTWVQVFKQIKYLKNFWISFLMHVSYHTMTTILNDYSHNEWSSYDQPKIKKN